MANSSSAIITALASSLPVSAEIFFLTGIVAHVAIRPFEIDSRAWTIFFSYVGVFASLLVTYIQGCNFTFGQAFFRTWIVASAFNTGLFGSILVYRAFLHRLHRFPGPFAAKLSRFYATKNVVKNLKANEDIQRSHQTYEDFVRVGPREISINRATAISAIYEPPMQLPRSPWYSQVSDDVTKISVNSTRDLTVHKNRKRAWMRGLGFRVSLTGSNEALAVYEDRIVSKVELLLARIADHHGTIINMTQYAVFFGFDVMGQVGFSKDFGMLDSGYKHPAIQGLHDNMTAVGILGTVPWLMSMLSKIPGATGTYARFTDWCGKELQAKRIVSTTLLDVVNFFIDRLQVVESEKEIFKDQDPRDVISWLIRAEDENDRSAPPGEGAFQEDSRLMIIAGSDTTSVALTNADQYRRLFYLTKHPDIYHKLQELVQAEFPGGEKEWTYERVKAIHFLDYIIYETLRLKPSVPAGLTRLTPPTGIQIDEVFIPGDTIVSVPAYTIHRDPRYWENALDFRPERWETLNPEKAPWIPFSRGQFSCPGRNLAFLELRMVLSRIALRYNLAFPAGADGERFDREAKDTFTLNVPELPIIFTSIN
ncbi:hypothetical protein FSARC_13368 [Fusarium sarcochroum]|uniref:Cytochrome P450 monooxygenase n=1 Tax=Fusarium sarcochroum TaxID=1208366 RepID=A0A8H4T226_9HYPO|nr:hypothetical protein FSARC_13368 [Fusarium sarcochroum]